MWRPAPGGRVARTQIGHDLDDWQGSWHEGRPRLRQVAIHPRQGRLGLRRGGHHPGRVQPPQIFFFADLFTIQRKRVEWSCESRVDTVDFEMLRWMRKAGCIKIHDGLESGSPSVLVTMKKDVTPGKILQGARLTREIGIDFKFFILYGFPGETSEAHVETEDLVCGSTRASATTSWSASASG
ncbi:MAG TPA: radical SAM protein [Planctomycetota bacterium]|nr:radical SAM protein [Planctomycetota bacterium]